MDFSRTNMIKILRYSLPVRFQDLTPNDFEDLMAQVFRDLGYSVQQTNYSGDFGADLLVEKTGIKTVVQLKRYAESNRVGVSDVNQAIGSKSYYEADHAAVVTTSSFTDSAFKLIEKTGTHAWDWSGLQEHLSELYLDGKDVYAYFSESAGNDREHAVDFEITGIEYEQDMKNLGSCTLVYARMTNNGSNAFFDYDFPVYISKSKIQVNSFSWYEGYFTQGTVYADSTVELAFIFRSAQVRTIAVGDRFIFTFRRNDGTDEYSDVTNQIRLAQVKTQSHNGCYIATMCYGKDSEVYNELTWYRDVVLLRSPIGRALVSQYYRFGGVLIRVGRSCLMFRALLKISIATAAILVKNLHNGLHDTSQTTALPAPVTNVTQSAIQERPLIDQERI